MKKHLLLFALASLVLLTLANPALADGLTVNSDGSVSIGTPTDVGNIRISGNTISSTDANGDIILSPDGTGSVVAGSVSIGGSLVAPTAGIIDVVQAVAAEIATSDTLAIGPFAFVPMQIVIHWTGRSRHDSTLEFGGASGICVVSITGTDTFTSSMHYTGSSDNNGALTQNTSVALDTTHIIEIYGGNDGSDWSYLSATGAWSTSTKTLTLTFAVSNSFDEDNRVGITAFAYR